LKLDQSRRVTSYHLVPPGFIAGSGLKPDKAGSFARLGTVPPGFIAGSGLKLEREQARTLAVGFLPASSPGAD